MVEVLPNFWIQEIVEKVSKNNSFALQFIRKIQNCRAPNNRW